MTRSACRFLVLAMTGIPALLLADFVDRAQVAGVDLSYPTVAGQHSDLATDPYSSGNAVCACDLDGDGWTDLIVTRTGATCLVFMNNHDGTFREEAHLRGLDTVSDIGGIAAGDFANKGSVDLFMAPASGPRYFLFVNDGTGHFQEVAVARGADSPVTLEPHKGQSVSLVDYDRDGYLDIYVCEWNAANTAENASHSVLLHNKGKSAPGFFENKTAAAGLVQPVNYSSSVGYSALWADLDGDGYPDLFLAADDGLSKMYWNNGDGTFTDGTVASGMLNTVDGMGAALLDYDGDGKIDIFVSGITLNVLSQTTGYLPKNLLFRNLGNRQFQDVTVTAGVSQSGWAWGAETLDATNKGSPDLLVTNGFNVINSKYAPAGTDPTKLFVNNGNGTFSDSSDFYGITDTGLGRSVTVLDYDNDGREDVFITQTIGHRILYHNENPAANNHWLALKFVGSTSNRDGFGAQVTLMAGGRTQTAIYNPTCAYLGQREPRLHFGLGTSSTVNTISIKWPSGTVQQLSNVAADQLVTVVESAGSATPPVVTTDLQDVAAPKDSTVVLSIAGQGSPAPVYIWYKNGTKIAGQNGTTLTLNRIQPIDAGSYSVALVNPAGTTLSRTAAVTVTADLTTKSVARWWDEATLDGVRLDIPNPPVHARNLFHLSAALWDSYWAYERNGWVGRQAMYDQETVTLPADEAARLAAQQQAMCYAAYTVVRQRYQNSAGSVSALAGIDWLMHQFGYDPAFSDATGSSPASVGLRIGRQVVALTLYDGANEVGNYADATGFVAQNPALVVTSPGTGLAVNPDYWQPLNLVNTVTQNGIVLGPSTQKFVGSNAINTQPFALQRSASRFPVDDPGPPPSFANPTTRDNYIQQAQLLIQYSSQLGTDDGATLDISPGARFNNPLGTNDGTGHPLNPYTNQPYASNVVLRGDYERILAEFWADGPNSETPPGHWNLLFNEVSDHPLCTHQFMGAGPSLPRLQWDVCGYLALNGALHDAACAAWSLKWEYDSARPITMIRYLAGLGQSSDPSQANYNASGLPLVPGLIEVITAASSAPGQRHATLADSVGQIAIRAWLGTPSNPSITSGVGWILATNWVPYQRNTFVTPAFPGFISGHSTFSRAGAEVLSQLTGSDFFPGGLATYDFAAGTALTFEAGPTQHVQLQWATYFDAADQAGLSRLFGGIHIPSDDFTGRIMGSKIGRDAFTHFLNYYYTTSGGILPALVQQPDPATTTAGTVATFRVGATTGGPFTFQWQRFPAGGSAWTNLADSGVYSGSFSSSLTVNVGPMMNGDLFRCVITNRAGSTTSNPAALSLSPASAINALWFNSTTFPATAAPGSAVIVSASVTNIGTNAWGANHYLVVRDENLVAGDPAHANLAFASLSGVAAGGSATVTLQFAAPTAPGPHHYRVQALENNVAWFSTWADETLTVGFGGADLNGDGWTDILWSNSTTGDRAVWYMNGPAISGFAYLAWVPTAWQIAGTGHFRDSTGTTDIVWENTATGDRSIWLMDGTAITSFAYVAWVDPSWHIAAVGDFNGDGQPDLLWENAGAGGVDRAVWFLDGEAPVGFGYLAGIPAEWRIVGAADFNADGQPDIVWENVNTGARSIWLMNGTNVASFADLGTVAPAWHIAQIADFDGDGQPDLLWENQTTGDRAIWLMHGTTHTSSIYLAYVDPIWRIAP